MGKKLPLKVLKQIKGIASDMNASYKKILQEWIRKKLKYETSIPEIMTRGFGIVDHFHLKQRIIETVLKYTI